MFYLNLILVNIIAWIALSYFWSFWTHKVFKPWGWLEMHKRHLLTKRMEHDERRAKDRVRYYTVFFALRQIERMGVQGELAILGADEINLVALLREQCPERTVRAVGPMEPQNVVVRRENCQGEVSEENVALDFAPEADVRKILKDNDPRSIVVKDSVANGLKTLGDKIALALIDTVDYDELLLTLSETYKRLSPGAMMIVHSYDHDWEAVSRATDVFAASVPERFAPVADMYGSAILVKN